MKGKLVLMLVTLCAFGAVGVSPTAAGPGGPGPAAPGPPQPFVPNSFEFWDFSKNWTTNYGPAYRDVSEGKESFVACQGKFALCFHSGAPPLSCHMTPDGRFATCTCTVEDDTNYVLTSAILNHDVYEKTLKRCRDDNSKCQNVNEAPVCSYLDKGKLIPGAQVISTFDTTTRTQIVDAVEQGTTPYQTCEGPFAGCMTAPCTYTKEGQAVCTCPVFWGRFQLYGANTQCDLPGDLIPSASYNPKLDPNVP